MLLFKITGVQDSPWFRCPKYDGLCCRDDAVVGHVNVKLTGYRLCARNSTTALHCCIVVVAVAVAVAGLGTNLSDAFGAKPHQVLESHATEPQQSSAGSTGTCLLLFFLKP